MIIIEMFNNKNQNNYNKIIYLKMIDNEISMYKREVLVKFEIKTAEDYRIYYNKYNPYVFILIKSWNTLNSYQDFI
jgi:hypothetical protein